MRGDGRGGRGDIRLEAELAKGDTIGRDIAEHRLETGAPAGVVEPHEVFSAGADTRGRAASAGACEVRVVAWNARHRPGLRSAASAWAVCAAWSTGFGSPNSDP